MHARFLGLSQRHLHDLAGYALNLDVHLQGSDAIGGAGHFEVHVAEVIFVAQNVGEHSKTVAVFDQAHSDAGHMRFHGHARIHQRQAASADRSHGRRTVGFGDFADHPHGVGEVFFAGQAGHQGALGQAAMADFAAFRSAHTAGFARGERRHVVVQHEAVFVITGQGVDALGVALGAQRGNHQSLGFAAGKQG